MTKSVGFFSHTTKQFSHISSVSYNSTQFDTIYPEIVSRNDAEAEIPILWPPHAKS